VKLRIGIVGVGSIATESHLPVLRNLENVEVAAVCDQRTAVAKEAASKFGVKAAFADLEEMLTREEIDVVDICTPPYTHAQLSIQAMDAGCHVLVEKPMATSVQEADRMIDSMEKNNAKLCVLHQNLCNPAFVKARRLVESGVVGDLLNVDARTFERKNGEICLNENHWCHKLPGGIFYEILPHPIYLVQAFLRNIKPVHILSRKLSAIKWMANDEIRIIAEAENGLGSITASCNSLIGGDTLDILGTNMSFHVYLQGRTLIMRKPLKKSAFSVGMSNLHLSLQLFKVLGSTASTVLKALRGSARVSAHYAFISEFIESICKNSKPPTTAEEGRENVKILEEICKQL